MAFDVVNCKKCGRLFQHLSGPRICGSCQKQIEESFLQVREYVRDNPDASIMEVSREMEVTVEQIKAWIREERLAFTDTSGSEITCLSCGIPIKTGKYCDKCKGSMAKELAGAMRHEEAPQRTPVKDTGSKMRFLGRDK